MTIKSANGFDIPEAPSYQNTLLAETSRLLHGHITLFAAKAVAAGYPFILWEGWVYFVEVKRNGTFAPEYLTHNTGLDEDGLRNTSFVQLCEQYGVNPIPSMPTP